MEKLYLEINFKNQKYKDILKLVLPAIKANIIHYNDKIDYTSQDDSIQDFFGGFRLMIAAQFLLTNWSENLNYNVNETNKIDFAIVTEEQIKSRGNNTVVYLQLFGYNEIDIGRYFFV